jgi:hypothetical protein
MTRTSVGIFLLAALLVSVSAQAQAPAERAAVERAVLDYVEGFYEGDTTKLVRGVSPDVVKYGFWIPQNKTAYEGEAMPWAEFLSYAKNVKARKRQQPATAIKKVEIYDVADQTASAKLTAYWGIDYLLLAKYNGKWKVRQVLWQTPPKK